MAYVCLELLGRLKEEVQPNKSSPQRSPEDEGRSLNGCSRTGGTDLEPLLLQWQAENKVFLTACDLTR